MADLGGIVTFVQIYEWRQALGLSRREVADMLGVAYRTVTNWECGYTTPHVRIVTFMRNEAYPTKARAIELGVNTRAGQDDDNE